ncbi:hypothetical protein BC827DRAFT_1157228 [Russula dissimulans]|nr:hypothetical protein BC827DRAFT_1157228 [Russula dissimulans]
MSHALSTRSAASHTGSNNSKYPRCRRREKSFETSAGIRIELEKTIPTYCASVKDSLYILSTAARDTVSDRSLHVWPSPCENSQALRIPHEPLYHIQAHPTQESTLYSCATSQRLIVNGVLPATNLEVANESRHTRPIVESRLSTDWPPENAQRAYFPTGLEENYLCGGYQCTIPIGMVINKCRVVALLYLSQLGVHWQRYHEPGVTRTDNEQQLTVIVTKLDSEDAPEGINRQPGPEGGRRKTEKTPVSPETNHRSTVLVVLYNNLLRLISKRSESIDERGLRNNNTNNAITGGARVTQARAGLAPRALFRHHCRHNVVVISVQGPRPTPAPPHIHTYPHTTTRTIPHAKDKFTATRDTQVASQINLPGSFKVGGRPSHWNLENEKRETESNVQESEHANAFACQQVTNGTPPRRAPSTYTYHLPHTYTPINDNDPAPQIHDIKPKPKHRNTEKSTPHRVTVPRDATETITPASDHASCIMSVARQNPN